MYICVCEYIYMHIYMCSGSRSCLTLCGSLDCSLPGSSVHGIFQARILKWVAISSSMGSFWPRDQTPISCTDRWVLYDWAEKELYIGGSRVSKRLHLAFHCSISFSASLWRKGRHSPQPQSPNLPLAAGLRTPGPTMDSPGPAAKHL